MVIDDGCKVMFYKGPLQHEPYELAGIINHGLDAPWVK